MGYTGQWAQPNTTNAWLLSVTGAAAATLTNTRAAAAGIQHWLRRIRLSLTSANAATTQAALIVLDGVTVIFQEVFEIPANTAGSAASQAAVDIDFGATPTGNTIGNLLTVTTAALNGAVAAALPASVSGALNVWGYSTP